MWHHCERLDDSANNCTRVSEISRWCRGAVWPCWVLAPDRQGWQYVIRIFFIFPPVFVIKLVNKWKFTFLNTVIQLYQSTLKLVFKKQSWKLLPELCVLGRTGWQSFLVRFLDVEQKQAQLRHVVRTGLETRFRWTFFLSLRIPHLGNTNQDRRGGRVTAASSVSLLLSVAFKYLFREKMQELDSCWPQYVED